MKTSGIFASLLATTTSVSAASLKQVTGFGTNPTGLQMYIYVPDKLAASPPVIVGLHPCGGSATQWFTGSGLQKYADQLGFIGIFAGTTKYSNCWDVQNAGSLTHGGQGDALGIVSMVNYTLAQYKGDAAKVFVTGGSSGAMMTNVMAGSYPDIFAGATAYSGTPFACFAGSKGDPTPMGANQTCAQGQIKRTAEEWGSLVKNAYPGYTGKRPKIQIVHGLADTLVRPATAYQALEQWGNVLGLTNTKNNTGASVPEGSAYTEVVYGDGTQVIGYLGQGVGHIAPPNPPVMLKFFGLM
ncbi:Alpha/Beta hydrolase protein [Lophiotrema nucula]|uniref:Carboxylic ester hydrolase n=1 Tax=Lophiotrema nucula TaxID=690887 RepID=A0A6A5ZIC3_9PLEO|nr:Alpha/Beta hydrolase protein [Lophiotrema nucula]